MVEKIIDAEESNRAINIVRHLEPKYRITEVPNPAYKKAKRDSQAFSPQPGSLPRTTNDIPAVNLSEVIHQREKRYTIKMLSVIKDICDNCTDCSDCGIAMEVRAADMCDRVKRNLVYMGVVEK